MDSNTQTDSGNTSGSESIRADIAATAAPTAVATRAPRKDNLIYLKPYFQGSINSFNTTENDINGNMYSTGLYGYMDRGDDDFQCYWKWRIDGEYTLLTATVFVRAEDIGAWHVGAVLIYGDDNLLFELDNIDSTTRAVPISVDISGVYDLKVEIFGDGNMYNYGIMPHLGDIYLS